LKDLKVMTVTHQHFHFNEHGFFNSWATAHYQALK